MCPTWVWRGVYLPFFDNKQPKETHISHDVPDRPWAKVGVDLFKLNKTNYLIIVDYFSGFWEIDTLENSNASHNQKDENAVCPTWYSCYLCFRQWPTVCSS